jgi:hypothetical protein
MTKVNLILIRAAIQERTGQVLSLERIRDLLLEEGLISKSQAEDPDLIFRGYAEYFETDDASRNDTTCDKITVSGVRSSNKPRTWE